MRVPILLNQFHKFVVLGNLWRPLKTERLPTLADDDLCVVLFRVLLDEGKGMGAGEFGRLSFFGRLLDIGLLWLLWRRSLKECRLFYSTTILFRSRRVSGEVVKAFTS